MTRRSLSMLVVLNAVLLAALSVTSLTPPAQAQLGGGNNFTMISGTATGRTSQDAVYVIDLNSSRMVALMFNSANGQIDILDGRVVSEDANATAGGGR